MYQEQMVYDVLKELNLLAEARWYAEVDQIRYE